MQFHRILEFQASGSIPFTFSPSLSPSWIVSLLECHGHLNVLMISILWDILFKSKGGLLSFSQHLVQFCMDRETAGLLECQFVLCFHPLVWWPLIFFMFRHHLIHCMLLKCIQFQYLGLGCWANWGSLPSLSRYRCIEEDAGLLDLEPLAGFPKGLEFHKAGEEPYDIKDIFSTSVESEALKETLFRQAKTQVCDRTCSRELLPRHEPVSAPVTQASREGRRVKEHLMNMDKKVIFSFIFANFQSFSTRGFVVDCDRNVKKKKHGKWNSIFWVVKLSM